MSDDIRVAVASYGDGRNLMMTFKDPVTGKKVARSSGTTSRRDAERAAAVWQDELNTGRYQAASRLTWAEFRKRYEAEKLAAMPKTTQAVYLLAFDQMERIINPDRLCKLTPQVMSKFQAELRKPREIVQDGRKTVRPGMKDTTIAKTLRHIKAALRWGERQGMIVKAPLIEMPKASRGKLMKGRPIVAEEFDRMLAATPKVRPNDAPAWERLLRGLWLSGLRLGEAVALSWDDEAPFFADLTGKHPRFRILGEAQKSGQDEILPMTPDFAQFLQATPEAERVGRVFHLDSATTGEPMTTPEAGKIISKIGRKAGVIVNKADGKYASAHDLRRSFGTRWAKRVMPAVLKRLMRHASIDTTMGYYVDMDADDMASDLWAKFGAEEGIAQAVDNTSGNTPTEETRNEESQVVASDHLDST
jgi:integrase